MNTLEEARDYVNSLSEEDRLAHEAMLFGGQGLWSQLPDSPQEMALRSSADVLFFGGAAGGGKTDLAIGLATEHHKKSMILRREATQLQGVIDRITELRGSRDGYNGQERIWRFGQGRQLELGSTPNPGDEMKYQGRPHDLLVFDEITHFTELQFRFLLGWLRSTDPGQRKRVLCTGNPPTSPEGAWVKVYWAPWLDPRHELYPHPPGELLWYATIDGVDTLLEDGIPFEHEGEVIDPKSRTFIPSFVEDNPFLMSTGYKSQLQALTEPLRSQMLKGDFQASMGDQALQVIPTAWVEDAMGRWEKRADKGPMSALGVDVARGGQDEFVLVGRHGLWFDELITYPGKGVPNGQVGAGLCVQHARDGCIINIDLLGVGTSVVDHLEGMDIEVYAINGAAQGWGTDRSGRYPFINLRSRLYWKFREMLDPGAPEPVSLPPDGLMLADLTAPTFKITSRGIQVESKEDLMKANRLGRSPDRGDAIIYASAEAESRANLPSGRTPDGYSRKAESREKLGWGSFKGGIEYDDTGII